MATLKKQIQELIMDMEKQKKEEAAFSILYHGLQSRQEETEARLYKLYAKMEAMEVISSSFSPEANNLDLALRTASDHKDRIVMELHEYLKVPKSVVTGGTGLWVDRETNILYHNHTLQRTSLRASSSGLMSSWRKGREMVSHCLPLRSSNSLRWVKCCI